MVFIQATHAKRIDPVPAAGAVQFIIIMEKSVLSELSWVMPSYARNIFCDYICTYSIAKCEGAQKNYLYCRQDNSHLPLVLDTGWVECLQSWAQWRCQLVLCHLPTDETGQRIPWRWSHQWSQTAALEANTCGGMYVSYTSVSARLQVYFRHCTPGPDDLHTISCKCSWCNMKTDVSVQQSLADMC